MSDPNSTAPIPASKPARPDKPQKPYPDFPLFPHSTGRWAKKVCGKTVYFGSWADGPDAALKKYQDQAADLHAGRTPRDEAGATIKVACNRFLASKEAAVESGELSRLTWVDYKEGADLLMAEFGGARLLADLRPSDFEGLRRKMAKRWGNCHLGKAVQVVRSLLKHAFDSEMIDKPVRLGRSFERPSKKTMRIARAKAGVKLFTAAEVRALVDGALVVGKAGPVLVKPSVTMRAMVLLGINAAFGNTDVSSLPISAVDLIEGWVDFARTKTGAQRRAWLWPETREAIEVALSKRPEPKLKEDAELLFLTERGGRLVTVGPKGAINNAPAKEFGRLLRKLHINGRAGLGFYTLRHVWRTVADAGEEDRGGDQPACDLVMGHSTEHISGTYRQRISDGRLRAVSETVRSWVYPAADAATAPAPNILPMSGSAAS